ncbi:hypothetical protein M885DRAFT_614462 [Pelagophyceae sp. CCMP2097]|nr:hypothetical protein M885DRAFT_614462 [Pelagophyceae sp. CCMP2097]
MSQVRCSHLLLKHTGSRNPVSRRTNQALTMSLDEAKKEMKAWRESILASSDPAGKFAATAKKRSDCGSFAQSGDLGAFGRGAMQKPFEDATFALEVGEISDIIETDSGVHIILRTPVVAKKESVRVAHLLCKHTNSRNPVSRRTNAEVTLSPAAARAELTKLRAEIVSSNDVLVAFSRLAKQRSDCSSCKQGGDLGSFGRGQMQKPFEDASFALAIGQLSEIIETDSGTHIILRLEE